MASGTSRARAKGAPRRRAAAVEASPAERPLARRLAWFLLGVAIVVPPFVFDPAGRDAFRLPKSLFFELAALASLLAWSFSLRDRNELAPLRRAPAFVAVAPYLAVATLLAFTSPHREHVHEGLVGLWVASLALAGWSFAFDRDELRRALGWTLVPAALLALVGALQFHNLFQPFEFVGLRESTRLAITSFAGNAGDLGSFLVLPALVAQERLERRKRTAMTTIALALILYGIAVTQTLAAAAALAVGTLLFWGVLLPARKRWMALASAVVAGGLLLALSAPLRERVVEKSREMARGDWNEVLTGRLDGWRAGVWMLERHPLTGVGVGAYRTEFLPAREALIDRGVRFFEQQQNVVFANAHNEAIEVGAELGLPGLLALGWALFCVARRLLRSFGASHAGAEVAGSGPPAALLDRAFAWAGAGALATLSLVHFPFRIAIVAGPAILWLAWLFAAGKEPA